MENDKVKVANGSAVVLSRTDKAAVERGVKVLAYTPKFKEYLSKYAFVHGTRDGESTCIRWHLCLLKQQGWRRTPIRSNSAEQGLHGVGSPEGYATW